jgi:hypothetical protein
MDFSKTKPCKGCPFRINGKHAVRLGHSRVLEVAGNMLNVDGGTFTCHEHTYGQETRRGYQASIDDVHCAGALIFALLNDNHTRAMQIAERLGIFDPDQFRSTKQQELVFPTIEAMLKKALPGR